MSRQRRVLLGIGYATIIAVIPFAIAFGVSDRFEHPPIRDIDLGLWMYVIGAVIGLCEGLVLGVVTGLLAPRRTLAAAAGAVTALLVLGLLARGELAAIPRAFLVITALTGAGTGWLTAHLLGRSAGRQKESG